MPAKCQPGLPKMALLFGNSLPALPSKSNTHSLVRRGIGKLSYLDISVDAPVANLFVIDAQNGQIRMGRRPLDSERGRQWTLNVSATEGIGPARAHTAYTAVRLLLNDSINNSLFEGQRFPGAIASGNGRISQWPTQRVTPHNAFKCCAINGAIANCPNAMPIRGTRFPRGIAGEYGGPSAVDNSEGGGMRRPSDAFCFASGHRWGIQRNS